MDSGHTVKLNFSSAFSGPEQCPACGSPDLAAVVADERTVFRCRSCEARWHLALGHVTRIDGNARCG
jgi:formate dehydrogenase maturation protein FdhE